MQKWHNKSWLYQKYHEEGLDTNEIADECGVTGKTIQYWFNKHDIERDSRGTSADGKYTDETWLRQKYFIEGKTLREIATLCDVTKTTIRRWFDRNNIDPNPVGRSFNDGKYNDEEWLREKYLEEEKTITELASSCGVSNATIHRALVRFNIDRRRHGEHQLKQPEERAPKGRGKGWKRSKRQALERAGYTCENPECSIDGEDLGRNPDVHHIVPFRLFDSDEEANQLSNLIVLCPPCHRQVEPNERLLKPISV